MSEPRTFKGPKGLSEESVIKAHKLLSSKGRDSVKLALRPNLPIKLITAKINEVVKDALTYGVFKEGPIHSDPPLLLKGTHIWYVYDSNDTQAVAKTDKLLEQEKITGNRAEIEVLCDAMRTLPTDKIVSVLERDGEKLTIRSYGDHTGTTLKQLFVEAFKYGELCFPF
ncbi:MAG: hypothetical protein KGH61_04130 [Candidatus Micrarchaeota archaeon]|nr:hypothetical protein [Candidatus Micrarchaeota archaeon]MDE1848109.1 hypothetical protein [Candidatus Micrarchaeota archaeon]MDE1864763.1 hypothetical protein [Candidatus Micrarchaeota archaeon]